MWRNAAKVEDVEVLKYEHPADSKECMSGAIMIVVKACLSHHLVTQSFIPLMIVCLALGKLIV